MTFVMSVSVGWADPAGAKGLYACLTPSINLRIVGTNWPSVLLAPKSAPPERSEARIDQINDPAVHRVRMLKQEAVTVHAPTGKVERQLERSVITIGGGATQPSASKVAVAMLPRAVSVMLVSTVTVKTLYPLMDGHVVRITDT